MLELIFIILALLLAVGLLLVMLAQRANLLQNSQGLQGFQGLKNNNQAWLYVGILLLPVIFAGLYLLLAQPSLWFDQQQQIAQQESNKTVIEQLQINLESAPDDYQGWLMLARSYQAIEQPGLALKAYQQAIAINAEDLDLLWQVGELAQEQQEFALTHQLWSQLYQQLPAESDAATNLKSLLNALENHVKTTGN